MILLFCYSAPKKVTLVPFYGGAKGQSLQITEYADGRIETAIVKNPDAPTDRPEMTVNASELENPVLPSIYELNDFSSNIKRIQDSAFKVVKLQDSAKKRGELTESEEAQHRENLEILNRSAQNLAFLQEELQPFETEGREGLSSWFERKATSSKEKKKKEEEKKKKEEEKKKKEEEEKKKKEEEKRKKDEEKKKKEEEKRKEEEKEKKKLEEEKRKEEEEEKNRLEEQNRKEQEKEDEQGKVGVEEDEAVEINLPQEDASVAEAKPVGLAVAGEGGVAASKPIATAVVGPGGLAIARPVGTAIAGISPDDPLLPAFISGYSGSKSKNGNTAADAFLNGLITKFHQS